MKFKVRIPLQYVKPVCIAAVLVGIFAVAAGSWITGLCLLLGAYLLEKSCYRCPHCGKKLDRKSTRLNSSHPSRSRMPSSA